MGIVSSTVTSGLAAAGQPADPYATQLVKGVPAIAQACMLHHAPGTVLLAVTYQC